MGEFRLFPAVEMVEEDIDQTRKSYRATLGEGQPAIVAPERMVGDLGGIEVGHEIAVGVDAAVGEDMGQAEDDGAEGETGAEGAHRGVVDEGSE